VGAQSVYAALRGKFKMSFNVRVAVCATTGIAATHIQGTTLNTALGIGAPATHDAFASMFKAKERVRALQVHEAQQSSSPASEMGGMPWLMPESLIRMVIDLGTWQDDTSVAHAQ
jgi:hypothetical protein